MHESPRLVDTRVFFPLYPIDVSISLSLPLPSYAPSILDIYPPLFFQTKKTVDMCIWTLCVTFEVFERGQFSATHRTAIVFGKPGRQTLGMKDV
jgi:hypothetical protein